MNPIMCLRGGQMNSILRASGDCPMRLKAPTAPVDRARVASPMSTLREGV